MENNFAFIEKETRAAIRYPVVFFVEFENGTGWTRNVSATGACIETDRQLGCGEAVQFFLNQPDRERCGSRVECDGIVVRAEQVGEMWQVALMMVAIRFEGWERGPRRASEWYELDCVALEGVRSAA